jgi:hypothetical protein
MSLCRFRSPCDSLAFHRYEEDIACDPCPGSELYIIETGDDVYECVWCKLGDSSPMTYEATMAHILAHDAAGHHVRKSLVIQARGEVPTPTKETAEFLKEWDT